MRPSSLLWLRFGALLCLFSLFFQPHTLTHAQLFTAEIGAVEDALQAERGEVASQACAAAVRAKEISVPEEVANYFEADPGTHTRQRTEIETERGTKRERDR